MKIRSHAFVKKDFRTKWYKKWAKELKQDESHLDNHDLYANKFWQNAIMAEILTERGVLNNGAKAVGFGVGKERLPAVFARHGVHVTATDQDFSEKKAGYWAKHELATGAQSLNELGICDPTKFNELVGYMHLDMNSIPAKLHDSYDFLWSNCALGHLGNIDKGLKFIENSLRCLVPGGWAVHTTELNILSDKSTVESGNTVLFRIKDIYSLQKKLLELWYVSEPFRLTFGTSPSDNEVSINPAFGNGYSKIQVMGHLCTQIVLIIHKPIKEVSNMKKARLRMQYKKSYEANKLSISRYRKLNKTIRSILKSQDAPTSTINVFPMKYKYKLILKQGTKESVYILYKNNSKVPLFSLYCRLGSSLPIALATSSPNDRKSKFHDDSWTGNNRNRPSIALNEDKDGKLQPANYIKVGQDFGFEVTLHANKVQKGTYKEVFSLVQEGRGWVDNSAVEVTVEVE